MSLLVDIKKSFKGFTLNLNFQTNGETTGILGASGSGKSMTLKCIAGIETPDSGKIILNDRVLFDKAARINLPPQKRNVGYLFQNYALFPHLTAEKNILCGVSSGNNNYKHRISQLLELFKLEGLEKRYPAQLSGGQQQRVALARILASEPELLLLDEPFSALDAHLKEELQLDLLELIRDYSGDVAIVTHNRDEAYKMCGDLIILGDGSIKEIGATKEMFQKCKNIVSARITGCKNIVEAIQLGDHLINVPLWNTSVKVSDHIPATMTHIGVRAYHFQPVYTESNGKNVIKVDLMQTIENPFHWDLLFACGVNGRIWGKHQKEAGQLKKPKYLMVIPENIMLLSSEDYIIPD